MTSLELGRGRLIVSTGNARRRVEDSADEDETVPITHIRHAARTHGAGVWRHYAAPRQRVLYIAGNVNLTACRSEITGETAFC